MDRFVVVVVLTVTSLSTVMKNAVYILSSRMITLIFKHFQRLSKERSITEDINTHSEKHCLLSQPFSVGIQGDFTHRDEMDFVHGHD